MNSGGSLIRDNCDCGSVETACAQLAQFADLVPGLEGACAAMGDCCEAGVTANSDFASCTQDSLTALNATLPDYNVLIPGGVPDLDALISTATNATAASGSTITTVAAEATATGDRTTVTPEEAVAATEAEAATTVAAATIPAEITTVTVADSGTTTATEAANTTTVPAEKEVEPVVSGASAYAVNAAFSFIVTSLVGYFV